MKKYIKTLPVLFSMLCLLFVACDDKIEYVESKKPQSIKIVDVTNNTIEVYTTNTYQVAMAVIPENAEVEGPVTFVYKSSDKDVFTVSSTGLITAVGVGDAVLNVTTEEYPELKAMAVVKITDEYFNVTSIEIASEYKDYAMAVGAMLNLSPHITVKPDNATNPALTFTSSDEEVATVNSDGVIETLKLGTATIKITPTDGSPVSVECKITVKEASYVPLERAGWTVTTQTHNDYGYMWDGPSGHNTQADHVTGLPEHLFDGELGSYLSLVKPGGSINGIAPPANSTPPAFIVDMKTAQEFEYILWGHRNGSYTNDVGTVSGNNYNYLRVFGVVVEGSNDGVNYTTIAPAKPAGDDANIVWIPQKVSYVGAATSSEDALYTIPITKSTYRYVKVSLVVQSKNYTAKDYQHPDYPGSGSTSGNTMQVAEFGLGKIVVE